MKKKPASSNCRNKQSVEPKMSRIKAEIIQAALIIIITKQMLAAIKYKSEDDIPNSGKPNLAL